MPATVTAAADRRGRVARLPARAAIGALWAYRIVLSPFFAGSCRYAPSCSRYAAEAIDRFGIRRGIWLATRRLARCHPLGGEGYDPVPGGAEPEGGSRDVAALLT